MFLSTAFNFVYCISQFCLYSEWILAFFLKNQFWVGVSICQVLKTLPSSSTFLKSKLSLISQHFDFSALCIPLCFVDSIFSHAAIVSFGKFTSEQRDEVEKSGLAIYSWDEFLLLVGCFNCQGFVHIVNDAWDLENYLISSFYVRYLVFALILICPSCHSVYPSVMLMQYYPWDKELDLFFFWQMCLITASTILNLVFDKILCENLLVSKI